MNLLREQPALTVFLVLGFGYLFGRIRLAGVQLGTSTGVLLGGLILGHFGIRGGGGSQSVGFILFIYCVGLRAGPQFFRAFRENGLKFAALALVVALLGSGGAALVGRQLGLPPGYSAGLLAGALTSTPTLVAAQDAIREGAARLPPGFAAETAVGNLAAAYAITYVVGLFGLLVVISALPRMMGIDLAAEARRIAAVGREGSAALAPASDPRVAADERPSDEADLITFAFGIAAGIAIGLITVRAGGIPVGLGTAGGLLFTGLVVGFLRTTHPTFGQLPVGATTVLMELGLQFFMANVGLEAGGTIVEALRATGPWLPIGALIVMLVPVLVGFAVGRFLLGFDPVILLGALTGSMTSTPALDMLNRQAESPLPTVGYAGTYAFANVLLAVSGSLLMRL